MLQRYKIPKIINQEFPRFSIWGIIFTSSSSLSESLGETLITIYPKELDTADGNDINKSKTVKRYVTEFPVYPST